MSRAPWFRCDPSKLIGSLTGMEPEQGYVYTMILMRIYEVGGPIDDDERVLARRTGHTVKKVTEAIQWLVAKDKVQRLETGLLDSCTTHEELAYREKSIKDAQNAGNSSSKKRAGVLFKKPKQLQQKDATPVERPLNEGATPGERPSTDLDLDLSKKELSSIVPKPAGLEFLPGWRLMSRCDRRPIPMAYREIGKSESS